MKWDIENKILIPFMILVILPILILGIMTYISGYQLQIKNDLQHMNNSLKEDIRYAKDLRDRVEGGIKDREGAIQELIDHFTLLKKQDMIIIQNGEVKLNNFSKDNVSVINISKQMEYSEIEEYKRDTEFYIMKSVPKLDIKIGYGMKRGYFSQELLEIQKYTLLITIIFLVISMQATILISHNISKPMKKLAEFCNEIDQDKLNQQIDMDRSDEVGILAEALNNMIKKLNINTKNLKDMKKYNEDILKNINIGILTTDKVGNIITVNHAGELLLNSTCMSDDDKAYLHDELMEELKQAMSSKESKNAVLELNKHVDINKQYIDMNISLLRDDRDDIKGAICSFTDITRRKKIENNIERINRLTSVGELAARLAHEIRNPLTGMKMSIGVLKKRLCDGEENNIKLFDSTLYEIDRLNNLVTELLDFARPHLPKYEITDIISILNKSIDIIQDDIHKKNVDISINTARVDRIFVDKAQLEQIIINVVKNSINAVENYGSISINIDSKYDKGYLGFSVIDNGCGIKQDSIEKIFNPFYTTNPMGTGLGLSVVHKLVTENNGTIDVKSKLGEGTQFTIKFPIYKEAIHEDEGTYNR